jgi:fibronectin-binding autotransporter adhesin
MPNLSRRGASFSNNQQGSRRKTAQPILNRKRVAAVAVAATMTIGLGRSALGDTLIFDASLTAPSSAAIMDGTGTWDQTTQDFFDTTSSPPDVAWTNGNNAVFGGGSSGTAGAIGVTVAQSFNNLTFSDPSAGTYSLSGSALTASGSIIDNLNVPTNSASVADAITFGSGATLSGGGTGTVSFTGALTGSVAITGGNFALTTLPSGTTQLSGGTLDIPNNYIPASSKLQLVGGTSSALNLGGTNISTSSGTFTNGSGYGKPFNALTYTGSGAATISILNGVFYGNSTNLSPQGTAVPPATVVSPTVFNLGLNGALGANSNVTSYITGITGVGDLFSTNASSTWTMTLTPQANTVYVWSGTTFNSAAGTQISLALTIDGSATGTQIFTNYFGGTHGLTLTQGNLVLAHSTGNNVGGAVTVNGGTLFVSGGTTVANATPNAVDQNTTVNSGGNLSDDTTAYNSILSQSSPAGASFVSAATGTLNSGANLTVINGAELLFGHLALNGANINAELPATGVTPSSTPFIDTRNSGGNTLTAGITVTPVALDSVNHTVAVGNYHVLEYYTSAGAFTSAQFSDFALAATYPSGYVYQLANNTTAKAIDLNVYNHSVASFVSASSSPGTNTGTAPGTAITTDTINLGAFNVGDGGGTESFTLTHILANLGTAATTAGLELSSVTPGTGNDNNIAYTPALFSGAAGTSLAGGSIELAGGTVTLNTSGAGTFSDTFTLNLEDIQAGVSGVSSTPVGMNAVGSETLTLVLDGSVASNTPEPGSFGLLSVAAMAALGRRRRRASSPAQIM